MFRWDADRRRRRGRVGHRSRLTLTPCAAPLSRQLESFSTPVLVTEMVVRASDARPARTVGLHGLLTLERRAPDGGGVGGARPGSAGEAGRVVSRVPGPASWPNQGDLADAHGPRPLSPRGGPSRGPPRGAGNGRPRSDSPGSPRSRDWQTPVSVR